MAEDWEAELISNAKDLRLAPMQQRQDPRRDTGREAKRQQDSEWERSGMWDAQQNPAREAEDRTRREADRAIGEGSKRLC
jgi:hypothetical protein